MTGTVLKAGLLSLLLMAAVVALAAAAKVRIDARAHLAAADSLRAAVDRSTVDLEAAGEHLARSLQSCTPFDPVAEVAARQLLETALTLVSRQKPAAAARLLALGIRSIDSCAVFTHPLAAERAEMERAAMDLGFGRPPGR